MPGLDREGFNQTAQIGRCDVDKQDGIADYIITTEWVVHRQATVYCVFCQWRFLSNRGNWQLIDAYRSHAFSLQKAGSRADVFERASGRDRLGEVHFRWSVSDATQARSGRMSLSSSVMNGPFQARSRSTLERNRSPFSDGCACHGSTEGSSMYSEEGGIVDDEVEPLLGMVGRSESIVSVWRTVRRVAGVVSSVLITGETGTGKELVARALHEHSRRSSGPFVRLNCGAISESLFESELFGHTKGAFTGAMESRAGRFEAAHGGTIFLDEINSLSLPLQVKLLRVLQEHEFERVGDVRTIRVDVRVVAATNLDLATEVLQGRFREDLYYRLNVIPIHLPPLRERRSDIIPLADSFARRHCLAYGWIYQGIPEALRHEMLEYSWPGNIRELQNYIERSLILGGNGHLAVLPVATRPVSTVEDSNIAGDLRELFDIQRLCREFVSRRRSIPVSEESIYSQIMSDIEKELITQVLRENLGIRSRTAVALGLDRNTLQRKIEEYGLQPKAR